MVILSTSDECHPVDSLAESWIKRLTFYVGGIVQGLSSRFKATKFYALPQANCDSQTNEQYLQSSDGISYFYGLCVTLVRLRLKSRTYVSRNTVFISHVRV